MKNKQLSVAIIKQEQSQQMQLAQHCYHSFWRSENSKKNKIICWKKNQKPRMLNATTAASLLSDLVAYHPAMCRDFHKKERWTQGQAGNGAQPSTAQHTWPTGRVPGPNLGRGCCVSGGLQQALQLCCASAEGSSGFAFTSGEEKTKYNAGITRRNNNVRMYLSAVWER